MGTAGVGVEDGVEVMPSVYRILRMVAAAKPVM